MHFLAQICGSAVGMAIGQLAVEKQQIPSSPTSELPAKRSLTFNERIALFSPSEDLDRRR